MFFSNKMQDTKFPYLARLLATLSSLKLQIKYLNCKKKEKLMVSTNFFLLKKTYLRWWQNRQDLLHVKLKHLLKWQKYFCNAKLYKVVKVLRKISFVHLELSGQINSSCKYKFQFVKINILPLITKKKFIYFAIA